MDIKDVKKNLNSMVIYKGIVDVYRLTACILRKGEAGLYYQAELFDTKHRNSVIIADLKDVEEITND